MTIDRRAFVRAGIAASLTVPIDRPAVAQSHGVVGVQSHFIGRSRLDVINVGDITLPLGGSMRAPQDADELQHAQVASELRDHRLMPMQDVLIRHDSDVALLDVGAYDITASSPYYVPGYHPPPPLAQRLASLGVLPEMVRHVVISHRHWDHFNGAVHTRRDETPSPLFPRARHYIQWADWIVVEEQMKVAGSREANVFGPLRAAGLVHLLDGDHQLAPGLDILAAPGETAGHQVVRVRSGNESAFCVGDLIHHPLEVGAPGFMVSWADESTNRESRARVFDGAAEERSVIIASHVRQAGRVLRTNGKSRWMNVAPGAPDAPEHSTYD